MALSPLTLSVAQGVQGRPFQATINGLTTGRVEVLADGSPGFSTVNGKLMSRGLPFAVSTVVLREYEPGVGQGYRDSRIDILSATRASLLAQATASLGNGRSLVRYQAVSETQPDGSTSYTLVVQDDLGASRKYVPDIPGAPATALSGVIVQLGDSIGGGWSDNPQYAAINMLGFPAEVTINNTLAMDGRSLGQAWIDAPNLFASMYQAGKPCVAVIQRSTNDMGNDSRSAIDTYAIATDLVAQAQRQGFYVVIATALPRTGTVFNWSTAKGAELLAYNDLVRANTAGADVVMDLYNDPVMGGATTPDNTALYRDKVHPTKAGQDRLVVPYKAAITPLLSLAPRASALSPTPIVLGSRTYGTGKFGKALASGQGIVALAAVPALAAPFTVEGWVRRSGTSGTFALIAGQRVAADISANPSWFIGVAGNSTVLRFSIGDDTDVTTTGVIVDGQWHHVAFVVEAAASRAYVDGQLVGSRAVGLTKTSGSAVDFGHFNTASVDFPWGGDLDRFAFFSIARYSANFTPPSGPVAPGTAGLLASYPLDGNAAGVR